MAQLTDLEKVRRQRARRRTVRGLVTLAVFAAVVFGCVALVRQAGEVDLRTAYSDIKEGLSTGAGFPVALPGGKMLRMDAAGDTLVLLSDTNLYTYNSTGRQMMNEQHGMVNPVLSTTKDRILAYDRGGNKLSLYTRSSLLGSGNSQNTLYGADLAANGNYVVSTDATDALAKAVVYNVNNKVVMDEEKRLFRWLSAERPILDVSLADGANELLVGHVDVAGGAYRSDVQKFLLSYGEGDIGRVELPGELLLSLDSRKNGALAITDQRAVLLDDGLREIGSVYFEGRTLDRFIVSPDGKLTLVLGSFDKEKKLSVRTFSPELAELGAFEVDFNILAAKADDDYLYLGGQDRLALYRYDGTPAAETPVQNLHNLQPIGQYLYYATNTAIYQLDVKALTAPPENSGASSGAVSGDASGDASTAPEESASEGGDPSGPASAGDAASGPDSEGSSEEADASSAPASSAEE